MATGSILEGDVSPRQASERVDRFDGKIVEFVKIEVDRKATSIRVEPKEIAPRGG